MRIVLEMNELTKIVINILLIIIGVILFIIPIVLRELTKYFYLITIGGFLIFIGIVMILKILEKHGIGSSSKPDPWDPSPLDDDI